MFPERTVCEYREHLQSLLIINVSVCNFFCNWLSIKLIILLSSIAPQFNNMTINSKNQLPAFHQSQDSILRSAPNTPPNAHWGSRTLRPIKHPNTRPPPPPIKAPLNPPACPPPPPPHRSVPPPPPPNIPPHKGYQSSNNVCFKKFINLLVCLEIGLCNVCVFLFRLLMELHRRLQHVILQCEMFQLLL